MAFKLSDVNRNGRIDMEDFLLTEQEAENGNNI